MLTQEELDGYMLDTKLIGERIKAARKLRDMTQEQLAEAANCTHTHICNIENGKIGISLELLFRVSVSSYQKRNGKDVRCVSESSF